MVWRWIAVLVSGGLTKTSRRWRNSWMSVGMAMMPVPVLMTVFKVHRRLECCRHAALSAASMVAIGSSFLV